MLCILRTTDRILWGHKEVQIISYADDIAGPIVAKELKAFTLNMDATQNSLKYLGVIIDPSISRRILEELVVKRPWQESWQITVAKVEELC